MCGPEEQDVEEQEYPEPDDVGYSQDQYGYDTAENLDIDWDTEN